MNASSMCRSAARGFTLIELMVTVAVAAIVLSLAIPSFIGLLARKHVEGTFTELQTDLQLARSEAVARNTPVRVTFGPSCYVIHTQPAGAGATSCSQTAASTIGSGATGIKTTQLATGSALLTPQASLTLVEFDPVRGTATWDGSGTEAQIIMSSASGPWQLRAGMVVTGRVSTCSPSGSITGYTSC